MKSYVQIKSYPKVKSYDEIKSYPTVKSYDEIISYPTVKSYDEILPNGGISDPHFLGVNCNFRFAVRVCQLYRYDQQLQLKVRKIIILATIRL